MLKKVEIKGYKSAYDVTLDLGPLTVLVGANGSGKSSILEAIAGTTAALRNADLQTALTWLRAEPNDVEDIISWNEGRASVTLVDEVGVLGRFSISRAPEDRFSVEVGPVKASGASEDRVDWRTEARLLKLEPELIAQPAISREERPTFQQSGANAGPVLDSLPRDAIESLEVQLRDVLPDVHGVRAGRKRVPGTDVVGHEPVFRVFGYDVRAKHASEGMNLVLAVLLALQSATGPTVVLLDDLQRGLHPKAQQDVLGAIRGLLSRNPDLQVVATTHSPYLVDALQQEEVVVVAQRAGRTHVRQLSEHPDAEQWRGELRAGEFWSAVGEDWVIDG